MFVILGLVILVACIIVGAAGVLTNTGRAHALSHPFVVLGHHVTGSSGRLFLDGIAVGAITLFGLGLLLAGAGRTSRRGRAARRKLRQSRIETVAVTKDRDDLIDQRETANAHVPRLLMHLSSMRSRSRRRVRRRTSITEPHRGEADASPRCER